jgi:sucrose-phosphate synthase
VGLVQAFAHSKAVQNHANLMILTGALDDPLREDASANPTEREVLAQIREAVKEKSLWGKVTAFSLQGQPALGAAYRFLARRRSVFAVTTHYEPFGLAPLEAAAAGLPVVVTKNGGPSESLLNGDHEYGVLVDPADPADIARGLERVLCDVDTWELFAQRGRQRVLDRYTWERTTQGYLHLIEGIVANTDARRSHRFLPIHLYFRHPRPETDVSLDDLKHLYFGARSAR